MKCAVREVVGEDAITTEDGQVIYERIRSELASGRDVELDFEGVTTFATLFFNAAIGHLLKDFTPDILNDHLRVVHLVPAGHSSLLRVIENAKNYYSSEDYREAQIKILKEMSEEEGT